MNGKNVEGSTHVFLLLIPSLLPGLNAVTSGDKEPAAVFLEDEDRFGLTNILRVRKF